MRQKREVYSEFPVTNTTNNHGINMDTNTLFTE